MKHVRLDSLFDVKSGNSLALNNLDEGDIPFIARGSKNNGIAEVDGILQYVKKENLPPFPGHCITVALSGSVLESFYQDQPFYTAYHVAVLYPKPEMSREVMFFYCTCIRKNNYKYSYGRQANKTIKSLMLPDIDYAESYVKKSSYVKKRRNINPPSTESFHQKKCDLKDREWGYFNLKDLFRITGSKTNLFTDLEESDSANGYPYVSTQATNNGVNGFVDTYTEDGNVLTIDSAVLGYCAYQEKPFSASDHVEKLIPEFKMNKYIAMFLVTVINQEQYRYNYGRKCSQTRLKANQIKLPCTREGKPDWEFMENFIKSQPYTADL